MCVYACQDRGLGLRAVCKNLLIVSSSLYLEIKVGPARSPLLETWYRPLKQHVTSRDAKVAHSLLSQVN